MRLDWIDDILAVLDGGSLAQGAQMRRLTQSAFTRRVRTIEQSIGTTLFDRRHKPVSLMPGVAALEPELREVSARMHKLRHALKTASSRTGKPLTFICQHALTTTISPQVVRAATRDGETSVRVRSGNQDECLMHLLSKEVDLAIMYALADDAISDSSGAFETVSVGEDVLVPVCAPSLHAEVSQGMIPMIAYPADVFLGQVFARRITPRLPQGAGTVAIAETALTLAMLQLAISGIGVAWLPLSLVEKSLGEGALIRIDATLPVQTLNIKMVRLRGAQTEQTARIWESLAQTLHIRAG